MEPRKTLAGYWKLNTDQSDDPRTKLEDARHSKDDSGGGRGGNGGRVGVGFPGPGGPGGGNGPYGGRDDRGMGKESDTNTERTLDMVRPSYAQNVALKDGEVDATVDRDYKLVFFTDGRKIQKSKDNTLEQVSARWNGAQLVTDEKGPRGRKMSRTLELSPDGRQLYETWHVENNGSGGSTIDIHYVYDAADQYQ